MDRQDTPHSFRHEDPPPILEIARLAREDPERGRIALVSLIGDLGPADAARARAWDPAALPATRILLAALDRRDREDSVRARALADAVLMLGAPAISAWRRHHQRVAAALCAALRRSADCDETIAQVVLGWLQLAGGLAKEETGRAHALACRLGAEILSLRDAAAAADAWGSADASIVSEERVDTGMAHEDAGFVRVGTLPEGDLQSTRWRDMLAPHRHIFGEAIALQRVPDLSDVRRRLVRDFPYATELIDTLLADLHGRSTVRLRPTLLLGEPGSGKSLFARRLGQELRIGAWRVDAAQCDGASLAGTARR